MNITILNGDMSDHAGDFSAYIQKLAKKLREKHRVNLFLLNQMNIQHCSGCWNCWWKTPGRCNTNDDAEQVLRAVINSDFVIFASPLMAGFVSSLLKRMTDRFVTLLHPYIEMRNNESHHIKRYPHYPDFGVILAKEPDTDEEDLTIVRDIYDRFALNFHAQQRYLKCIETSKVKEVVHETSHYQRIAEAEEE